jgi:L-asparaginase II
MGKAPKMLAPNQAPLAVVACHPKQPIVAAGYSDGLVLLVRIADGAEILAKRPGAAAVTGLAFSADGGQLAFGCEDGEAGILPI